MKPKTDEWDIKLTARIVIDDYWLSGSDTLRRECEFDTKRRLRREIERKLPEGYTLDDCYGEYVTYREERQFGVVYELRVYL